MNTIIKLTSFGANGLFDLLFDWDAISYNLKIFLVELALTLDGIIYSVVSYVYEVFIVVSEAKIISNTSIQDVAGRVYLLLGVIMVFVVSYSLLKGLVNPDELNEGDTGLSKTVGNIVKAIAVIVLTPTVFSFAMKLQSTIVYENIIGKVVVGATFGDNLDAAGSVKVVGYRMATSSFRTFFYARDMQGGLDSDAMLAIEDNIIPKEVSTSTTLANQFFQAGSGGNFDGFKNYAQNVIDEDITYLFPFSTIAGIFLLYIILLFCIDLGLRAVKLGVYQLIAPIPALCLIIPGQKKIFDNWLKECLKTYMEIFVRLFIIFFGLFLIGQIQNLVTLSISKEVGMSYGVQQIVVVLLIVGILMFIKQAPKLLGEIFGFESKMNFNLFKKIGEIPLLGSAAGRAIGLASGALGAGAVGLRQLGLRGGLAGMFRGGLAGMKDKGWQYGKQGDKFLQDMTGNHKARASLLGGVKRQSIDKVLDNYAKDRFSTGRYVASVNKKNEKLAEREEKLIERLAGTASENSILANGEKIKSDLKSKAQKDINDYGAKIGYLGKSPIQALNDYESEAFKTGGAYDKYLSDKRSTAAKASKLSEFNKDVANGLYKDNFKQTDSVYKQLNNDKRSYDAYVKSRNEQLAQEIKNVDASVKTQIESNKINIKEVKESSRLSSNKKYRKIERQRKAVNSTISGAAKSKAQKENAEVIRELLKSNSKALEGTSFEDLLKNVTDENKK